MQFRTQTAARFFWNCSDWNMTMAEPAEVRNDDARLEIDKAADALIAASDGDARSAVVALLIANKLQEHELHLTRLAVSSGYARQRHLKRTAEETSQT